MDKTNLASRIVVQRHAEEIGISIAKSYRKETVKGHTKKVRERALYSSLIVFAET